MVSASRNGPGKTYLAPTISAAKGMPQPLAWKSGTIERMESLLAMALQSTMQLAKLCITVPRWEYTTPLGRPVVPEV